MKKNYFTKNLFFFAIGLASLQAFAQDLTNGIFILNEGTAGSGNASVSFLEPEMPNAFSDIYTLANPEAEPLGDVAQSLSFQGDRAYIALNMSNTVKVVNRTTFAHIATISEGLENPRYIAFHGDKGYITNWGSGTDTTDDYIAILDLATNTITGTIPAAEGVERIIEHDGKIYVAHQGGYGHGNTISVIDTTTDTIEDTITVGDVPNRMVIQNGFLYVLCGGKPMWAPQETNGALVKVSLEDYSVAESTLFEGLHPANLNIDGDGNFYFSSDADVFKSTLAAPATHTLVTSLTAQGAYGIYGMDLIDNSLYVADAGNYVSPGTAYVFSTSGTQLGSYQAGVIPNGFYKAESVMGLPGHEGYEVTVYPNPTAERFFLTTANIPDVIVYDYSGKEVFNGKYTPDGINVAAFAKGIYLVTISEGTSQTTRKLVVK
ncbi:DUF5074 domain-containing protein [uncultured Flavobacterium sp.]|uniref:DUF5074 domain-containing protein n=1 Tax=uncultured Flavobacterium sp. TaxID=165435 RepID=UPI0025FCC57F|nr:DUF5074 domain-containing protein [uncultured Flavobacterium sp.]